MSQTLSQDLRCRVIAAVDGGMSRNAAARRCGVGISRAIRWVREWRSTGVATAKPKVACCVPTSKVAAQGRRPPSGQKGHAKA